MRFKLTNRTSRTLLLLLAALTLAAGTAVRAAEPKVDRPGADRFGVTPPPPAVPPTIDPLTGLPRPPWKDPEWPDPDKRLSELFLDAIPLREVVELLQKEFKWAFDVLIPNAWQDTRTPPRNPAEVLDPGSTPIKMQLKNVTASEAFNAMNFMFDLENTPYRWELRMNGNRPTAILRVLPELVTPAAPAPPAPQTRQVFFVGDLTGDEKPGRMTMEQLVKTVSEVYQMSYGSPKGVLQFHKEAQLLIVTGTDDMISFAQQTLAALREKVRAQEKTNATEPKVR